LYGYKVRVESTCGIVFAQEAFLGYSPTKTVAMVQTDKGIYKPGDRVRFRVIYTDRQGLAENVVKSTVYITDGKGNRIKEWKFNGNLQGVFSENFLLSKEPVLGFWNIYVNVDDETVKVVNFKVEEYVLPKFEVKVSPSGISSFKKGKFVVIVDAKYTYGKPVKGSATVQISHPRAYKLVQLLQAQESSVARIRPRPIVNTNYIRKVVPINGRAIVEFDIKKDFLIDEVVEYVETISVEATVTEELTGIALVGNNNIPIYPYDYVITVTKQDTSFKPGLPFHFEVQISKPDGKPYVPRRTKLEMTTFYGFDDERGTNSKFIVDKSGKVRISNTAPLSAVLMDFKFRFKGATASLYLTPEKSESGSYIRARTAISK
jgi:CD109 antigen